MGKGVGKLALTVPGILAASDQGAYELDSGVEPGRGLLSEHRSGQAPRVGKSLPRLNSTDLPREQLPQASPAPR